MPTANPLITTVNMGWGGAGGLLANNTRAVNSAVIFEAVQFVPMENKTINEIWFYVTAVTGTVNGIRGDIYNNNAGLPGTSSANSSTVNAYPTGAALVKVTGLSLAVTGGVPYWAVIRNTTGTPASNNFTISEGRAGSNNFIYGTGDQASFVASNDSGTSWALASAVSDTPFMIKYSDGTFDGWVNAGQAVETGANSVYAARELGSRFTSPPGLGFQAVGGAFAVSKSGTPTGNLRYRLYEGTTLVATTNEIAPADVRTTAGWDKLYFSSAVYIKPNTDYRFVMAESSQADASGNRYNAYLMSIPNDTDCKAQKPFNGTMQKTYLNGTWSEVDTDIVPFMLFGKESKPALSSILWPERGNV